MRTRSVALTFAAMVAAAPAMAAEQTPAADAAQSNPAVSNTAVPNAAISGSAQPSTVARSQLVRSPAPVPADDRLKVFLAGSIDMGGTQDWQAQLARELADEGVVLLNPRREDWNPAWKPVAEEPEFRRQVEWELTALQRADVIAMYLAPGSQAPVSLLELGLHAGSGKVLLACPDGFWRKGNVDIVAQRYGIPRYDSLPALAQAVRERLAELRRARAR
ncbi:nucleoside 2-deoxyribosyltransferase domain-containing protein [Lysobacter enzymogenes]|uniref:nucleoside 2-deoxyribosyltransferase domain-containing protein n=1 Tax=Lysobacter enzymogenes TaxID=69 RepID=UPI001B8CEF64|nr:nucleoside 2-deoxyribosyltransferase domain-containing protein [Lysobacter enzymogenes]